MNSNLHGRGVVDPIRAGVQQFLFIHGGSFVR